MVGVIEAEFYVQYMFSNGPQCDTVQEKKWLPFIEVDNLSLHSMAVGSN